MHNFSDTHRGFLLLIFLTTLLFPAFGEETKLFRFDFSEGARHRILGINRQQVYLNGELSHSAVLVTRVVEETTGLADGEALFEATYQVTEENLGLRDAFSLEKEYTARFGRTERGNHRQLDNAFMPVLRGFPILPEGPVSPGDRWSAEALEVHDFRRGYGIEEPYEFPVPVSYTYVGPADRGDHAYEQIEASYNIFYQGPRFPGSPYYPELITGTSEQQLYWDEELGRVGYSEEEYTFLFLLNTGDRIEYRGRATYEILEIPALERRALREELEAIPGAAARDRVRAGENRPEATDLEPAADAGPSAAEVPGAAEGPPPADRTEGGGIRVEERDEGLTVILDEVYFEPDSARLTPAALETLEAVSRVLDRVGQNEILVTGHTALAGTAAGRESLSKERARRVAEAIVNGGSHREEQILYRGMGARQPAANNATEAGRRKNRRVEITILE